MFMFTVAGGFRRIRHYFIPANNMMSDVDPSLVTDSCVQNVIEKLDDLIANTFEVLSNSL